MKNWTRKLVVALLTLVVIQEIHATTVFPIATNASLAEFSGGIAGSGSNFLVTVLSGTNVCAQLVSTNGTLIGSLTALGHSQGTAAFTNSSHGGNVFPPVAFGRTNYLVVWYDSGALAAYGQIISSNGAPVGSAFSLASNTNFVPEAVASDHTNFLVILEDFNRNFYGQFVTGGGALSGSAFFISSQQQNGKSAAAAFGKTNYLVVWQSNNGSEGNVNLTFGAFVATNRTVGSPIQIGQTTSVDQNPLGTAFDGTNFLVVWNWHAGPETEAMVTNWEVFGRLVSLTGTFPGNELELITDPGNDQVPGIAFDGSDYLLTWGYGFDIITNTNIRFQFLDRNASAVGPEFTLFTAQGTNAPLFAFNGLTYDGTRFAVAATLGTSNLSSGEVYGGLLSPLPTLAAGNYAGTQFSLTLTGTPGFNYAIQYVTNAATSNWTALVTNSPTNGTFTFTDVNATNKSRFYRAVPQ